MDKKKVIETVEEYLRDELKNAAGDEETTEDLRRQLVVYRFLPRRTYTSEDVIIPSTLVELGLGESKAYYLIVPKGGGLVTRVDDQPVQVITPNSPLGEALLGKKVGDTVSVEIRGGVREYRVLSIC